MAEHPRPYAAIALLAIVLSIIPITLLDLDGIWIGFWGMSSMWAAMILGSSTFGYLESLRARHHSDTRYGRRLNRFEVRVFGAYEGAVAVFVWLLEMIAALTVCVGVLIACSGVLLIGTQCYFWLMEGQWQRSSAIELVALFNSDWARYPDTWKGLWKVIDLIPQSLVFLVFGCVIAVASGTIKGDLALPRKS